MSKSGLKLVCNVNMVYGHRKSENSQDYTQRSQRNCAFMNSASETSTKLYVHEFGFCVHKSTRILIRGNGDVHTFPSWHCGSKTCNYRGINILVRGGGRWGGMGILWTPRIRANSRQRWVTRIMDLLYSFHERYSISSTNIWHFLCTLPRHYLPAGLFTSHFFTSKINKSLLKYVHS